MNTRVKVKIIKLYRIFDRDALVFMIFKVIEILKTRKCKETTYQQTVIKCLAMGTILFFLDGTCFF